MVPSRLWVDADLEECYVLESDANLLLRLAEISAKLTTRWHSCGFGVWLTYRWHGRFGFAAIIAKHGHAVDSQLQ